MHVLDVVFPLALLLVSGCSEEGTGPEECHTDEDCLAGQVCVITHDHEGDDHDHGGDCEASDTAGR